MDHVHFNAVQHGLVTAPGDRPYATFRACVACGVCPEASAGEGAHEFRAGERGG
jgi:hypothetical protein